MKTFRLCVAFAILFSSLVVRAQSASEEQAVAQLTRELAKAYVEGDAKTLERILADELTYTSDGLVTNKQYQLRSLSSRNGLSTDFHGMNVRIYGNAAVVTGAEALFETANKDNAIYYSFTDTFVKRAGGWQLIATQRQRVPVWKARPLEISELKVLAVQSCDQESSLRSSNGEATFIRFMNETSKPVVVYWLNYEGKRDPSEDQRETIQPGQSGIRITYITHPFLVTDAAGKCLGIYLPTPEPSLAVIK
jgi:uncharacterized protein DUF4440